MYRTHRQARIDLATPAEQSIRNAMAAVEAMPAADVRLTKAVTLLAEALEQVGNYIDEQLSSALPGGERQPR